MFINFYTKTGNSLTKRSCTISIIAIAAFGLSACFAPALNAQQNVAKTEKQTIGLGLKAGYNFANVTGASSISAANTSGFHIGGFYSPGSARSSGLGYRTELVFSRQGYDFAKGNTTGTVKLDYILFPQLTTISITRFVQLQLGAQIAFLINAKADSMVNNSSANAYSKVAEFYNKIDYGFAGGIELHPIAALLVGARLNIGLANANKEVAAGLPYPSFIPNISDGNLKNNTLQVFAGWRF